jgi:molecular chaperone GrpE
VSEHEEKPSDNKEAGEQPDQQAQIDKWKNDYLYLRAEFDNYRKHVIKERADLLKYGAERLLHDLLNVSDNFERALETKATPENLDTYVKGVEMTAQELKTLMQKHGVTEVKSLGEPFNPTIHEALSSEESNDIPEGHVLRVFKKPFKLHDRVIRPGQVVVSKKPKA